MIELTAEIIRERLDAFGPPRHLSANGRQGTTVNDMRRWMRNQDQRSRIRTVAKKLRVPVEHVSDIWNAMLRSVG